jgi:hypothetical protein
MARIYKAKKIIATVIPFAYTVFALLVFHALILPAIIRARTMRVRLLEVLLRIPQSSIQDIILKKYEPEGEEDDMDDELDKEKAKREKIKASKTTKTLEKTILKEWNVKLYFQMMLLFGSIALLNLAYVSYGLTQITAESQIFETIRDLDVVHQDVYQSIWQATGLFGYCEEGGTQLCDDFHGTQEILNHTAAELNDNFRTLLQKESGSLSDIFYGEQCLSSSPWKCDATLPIPEDVTGVPPDYAHSTSKGLMNMINV